MIDLEKLAEIAPNARFEVTYLENDDKTALTRTSARIIIDLTLAPSAMPQGLPPVGQGNLDRQSG